MISVLLVDDHALVRMGLRLMLDSTDDLHVVGEAADGGEAITLVAALRPDVVVMDVRMPAMNGIDATRHVVGAHPEVRVLILTTFGLDEYAFSALRAGASGFLVKDAAPADLVTAVRTVAAGDAVVSPRLTMRMLDMFADVLPASGEPAPAGGVHPRLTVLTPREVEVLRSVAEGLSNAEIAAALRLSEATVKTHLSRILPKLGARDRVQAVVIAYETGLVRADLA